MNRHWWLQTRLCHKSLDADSLGYARLHVRCRCISLLVLSRSSWKGRQSWSLLALSGSEGMTWRTPSCLFFYSLPLCTVNTSVLQEQIQRAARHSEQDFLSCSLLWNLWSLQSPVKAVSYIPWWELPLSWCSAVLQEHTPYEDPSQCRSVAAYTEQFIVLFHIKARHHLLPFIYIQNSPRGHQKMCPYSAVLYSK